MNNYYLHIKICTYIFYEITSEINSDKKFIKRKKDKNNPHRFNDDYLLSLEVISFA